MAKQLKEKCRGGGGGGGTNNAQQQQQQQSLNEEQFLKFFLDDVWEKRVKQMMVIRSLFLYLDRTTVTLSSANANASRNIKQQLPMNGGNDPTSPLDDDERRRRSETDAATTTMTTTASKESVTLPLWELSVQQFQKQMDANVDVLRKASSG